MNVDNRPTSVALLAALAVLGAGSMALAQPPASLSGTWQFETTMTLSASEGPPCAYEGTANVLHSDSTLSGTAAMTLLSGPPACPPNGTASLSGKVDGAAVTIQLDGGGLGVALLQGQHAGGEEFAGTMAMESGPIDADGTWAASLGAVGISIPTVGVIGGVAMVLLLASASLVVLRARSMA
jgi:hypothetical protein